LIEALQDRLKVLEDEILRLINLASQSSDRSQQDNYWLLARDLQREARNLRVQIKQLSESAISPTPKAVDAPVTEGRSPADTPHHRLRNGTDACRTVEERRFSAAVASR
jgi:hypothetical protein